MLTLFHPASGQVRARGVKCSPNVVLQGRMKEEQAAMVATLPPRPELGIEENRKLWESWQEGLQVKITLLKKLPPLRMLLGMGNLAWHKTPEMMIWLFEHGIMPLDTPLSAVMTEYGRIDPTDHQAASCRESVTRNNRRDDQPVRGDGERMGSRTDALRVGRETSRATSTRSRKTTCVRGLWSLHTAGHQARAKTDPAMVTSMSNDPLV